MSVLLIGLRHGRRFIQLSIMATALVFAMLLAPDIVNANDDIDPSKSESGRELFSKKNLVAWCIVPFDGKKRGPAERAALCAKLGFKKIAYDWRDEHVPAFEQEILEYKKHGLEMFAFWSTHEKAFQLFEKYDLHPQIWTIMPDSDAKTQEDRIAGVAEKMLPLVERTKKMGCKLGLYNHGGWAGEPDNLIAVCEYLKTRHHADHVGIVYNQHHAHDHIDDFAQIVEAMKPHLLCLNLNGMTRDGDKNGQKIMPLGQGEFDVHLLKIIQQSGYTGPIGIIGHTQDDVELRLRDNLEGLDWLISQVAQPSDVPKPNPRTWTGKSSEVTSKTVQPSGVVLKGSATYRQPPISVECRVRGLDSDQYNILVANDTKRSSAHWEIFTMPKSGHLTVYAPGLSPDHIRSQTTVCDGKPHNVGMNFESGRIRLYVDGQMVADQSVEAVGRNPVDGGLAIGQLVEGGIGCSGTIDWVRISRPARDNLWSESSAPDKDEKTVLLWKSGEVIVESTAVDQPTIETLKLSKLPAYSPVHAAGLVEKAMSDGDAARGVMVFAAARSACLGCHRIGAQGGTVGPPLSEIAKQRKSQEIVDSVLWPNHKVEPEFVSYTIVDDNGMAFTGYLVSENDREIVLRDPTKGKDHRVAIPVDDIEFRQKVGSLMPENLTAALSEEQLLDLFAFLFQLGRDEQISLADIESVLHHAKVHMHGPASFTFEREPLKPALHPYWEHYVNRDRIYDFYAKEAIHFRDMAGTGQHVPELLMEFPGLDGGTQGHWGNQHEEIWASDAWNHVKLGTVQTGVFRGAGVTVPRGVCVRFGDDYEMSCCFNTGTLSYEAVWTKGFVKFSSVRHGFMDGLLMDGDAVPFSDDFKALPEKIDKQTHRYNGFYRVDGKVVFSYRIGDVEYLDSPGIKNGSFVRVVSPFDQHPLSSRLDGGSRQWPEKLKTEVTLGDNSPYAIDTIAIPKENPWNIPIFSGGVGFLSDGSALVCTMHGDVWRVSDYQHPSKQAVWSRFASGLYQCLGLVVQGDEIFVLGRDQLTLLKDINQDGEADFYECFSQAYETSPAGHDFICGLECDQDGNFYTASGNQGVIRISADGERADVIATGFRNPDGISLSPDGLITVPCSEGSWTPASMICGFHVKEIAQGAASSVPYFGFGGPRNDQPPSLPMAYLPRAIDNSAGGQQYVNSDRWGPLQGQLLHFSFGTGNHFLLLRDEVGGQLQGAIVPLAGDFLSGAHRGRFNPADGQLYVAGMQGWGCYTPDNGSFQRVRYTGDPVQLPIGFHAFRNGLLIRFSAAVEREIASNASNHFAQCWNYRYSSAYGSPEFSTKHDGMRGHDRVDIKSAHVVGDGQSLFLEIPDLQPVNQLHLLVQTNSGKSQEMFVTVNRIDEQPFTEVSGLVDTTNKRIDPHPILADLALATRLESNPHANRVKGGRQVRIETGNNLSFATRSFNVRPGELIEFTLVNPDVVPHNWALVQPGKLKAVGDLANRLISDPDAVFRHYIPETSDVLAYTSVVAPKSDFTIYFKAPAEPGVYPYLCTFPGHWLVMNGQMIVEP